MIDSRTIACSASSCSTCRCAARRAGEVEVHLGVDGRAPRVALDHFADRASLDADVPCR